MYCHISDSQVSEHPTFFKSSIWIRTRIYGYLKSGIRNRNFRYFGIGMSGFRIEYSGVDIFEHP